MFSYLNNTDSILWNHQTRIKIILKLQKYIYVDTNLYCELCAILKGFTNKCKPVENMF